MLKTLLCFFQFLCILKFIKVCENSHNLGESMNLQNIKELKSFLQKKKGKFIRNPGSITRKLQISTQRCNIIRKITPMQKRCDLIKMILYMKIHKFQQSSLKLLILNTPFRKLLNINKQVNSSTARNHLIIPQPNILKALSSNTTENSYNSSITTADMKEINRIFRL